MPVIKFVNKDKQVEVNENANLLRSSIRYEGEVPYKCGGGLCGTCHVKVEEGLENLDKVKPHEVKRLGQDLIDDGHRLACQSFLEKGEVAISWVPLEDRKKKGK